MKLKYLVAALGLVASLPTFATIADSNAPSLGDELFLVVWEQGVSGKPDQSFTFDTGVTYGSFVASANISQTWADITTANTGFFNFLASSDLSSLQYAVMGGKLNPTPATMVTTVHVGDDTSGALNGQISTALTGINGYLADVNTTGTHPGATSVNGQSVNVVGDPAYFQDGNRPMANNNNIFTNGWGNSNLLGVASEFLSLNKVTGPSGAVANQFALPGIVNFGLVGSDYVLSYTVAAVPEPSSLGMALAGLGVLGFMGLRRKQG